jgi:hypothetical protein
LSNRPEPLEASADPISVERTGGVTWRVAAVIGVIAVVIGVAVVKPWQSFGPTRAVAPPIAHVLPKLVTPPKPTLAPTPMPTATLEPAIEAASGRMLCNAPQQWRLISSETDIFGRARTMYGDDAAQAAGPTDPRIPVVLLHATMLNGIGVCRPNPGAMRVADLPFNPVTIWRVSGISEARAVAMPRILSESLYRLGEAYYGPPEAGLSWPAGRYVVEITGAAQNGQSLWIALDFVAACSRG